MNSQHTDPEPTVSDEGNPGANRRSVVKSVLKGLIGWQVVPAIFIGLYLFVGIFGPTLAPFEPTKGTFATRLCPPLAIDALITTPIPPSRPAECSATNILGTDQIGRDIFSRMLHGTRTSFSIVTSSVLIGTIVGVVVGVLINGLRPKRRLIAYIIVGTTIVPTGFLLVSQPVILAVFNLIPTQENSDDDLRWSAVTSFTFATIAIALLLIGVAYRFDDRCRPHWFDLIGTERGTHECLSRIRQQVIALGPWIAFAVIASHALTIPRSIASAFQTSTVRWSLEYEYLFEHVGMFSPIVPTILFPLAFLSFGAWWVVQHLLVRFNSTPKPTSNATLNTDSFGEGLSSYSSSPTENPSDHVEAQPSEHVGKHAPTDAAPPLRKRRWLVAIIGIVAAMAITRFAVAEAVPTFRELTQDWTGDYQSALSLSVQGRQEALDCANEFSSRLRTLRVLPSEQLEIDAGQRCLDLYFQHRNAPTHRSTFDYAVRFLSQTLTLALIGCIVAAALWTVASASTSAARRVVGVCIVLVALIGLTMTFGNLGWSLVVTRWFDPVYVALSDQRLVIAGALNIVRDFSVALGISYLTIAITKPTIRFEKAMPKLQALYRWMTFFVPCILLTSGLLILFHYRFPSYLLFYDNALGVIADPSQEQIYITTGLTLRNWLWTYWFAVISYCAIVFGLFAAAFWGFKQSAFNGHFYR